MMQVLPAGCAPRVNRQAIALLDPVHRDRTALRIEEGKFQLRARAVLFAGDDTAEGIFRLHRNDISGIDGQDRLGIGAVDIVERSLCRDRELVAFSAPRLGEAPLRHDRSLEPGIVGHRDILKSGFIGIAFLNACPCRPVGGDASYTPASESRPIAV
jgi:hypothetical protein